MGLSLPALPELTDERKARLNRLATDLRDVVMIPLISGLMFGIGTATGKRFAEAMLAPSSSYSR